MNRFSQKVIIVSRKIWIVLVWQIKNDSPNSPNFFPAKLSHYTVHYNVGLDTGKVKIIGAVLVALLLL